MPPLSGGIVIKDLRRLSSTGKAAHEAAHKAESGLPCPASDVQDQLLMKLNLAGVNGSGGWTYADILKLQATPRQRAPSSGNSAKAQNHHADSSRTPRPPRSGNTGPRSAPQTGNSEQTGAQPEHDSAGQDQEWGTARSWGSVQSTDTGEVPEASTSGRQVHNDQLRTELVASVARERALSAEVQSLRKGYERAIQKMKAAMNTGDRTAEEHSQLVQQHASLETELGVARDAQRQAGAQLQAVSMVARQMARVLDTQGTQQTSALETMGRVMCEYMQVLEEWSSSYAPPCSASPLRGHCAGSPDGPVEHPSSPVMASPYSGACGNRRSGCMTPGGEGNGGGLGDEEREYLLQQIWLRDQLVEQLAMSLQSLDRSARKGTSEGANLLAKIVMLSAQQQQQGPSDSGVGGSGSGDNQK